MCWLSECWTEAMGIVKHIHRSHYGVLVFSMQMVHRIPYTVRWAHREDIVHHCDDDKSCQLSHSQCIRLMNIEYTSHIHRDIQTILVVLHMHNTSVHITFAFHLVFCGKKCRMNGERIDTLKIKTEWVSNCIRFTALILMDFLYNSILGSLRTNTQKTHRATVKFVSSSGPVCKRAQRMHTDRQLRLRRENRLKLKSDRLRAQQWQMSWREAERNWECVRLRLYCRRHEMCVYLMSHKTAFVFWYMVVDNSVFCLDLLCCGMCVCVFVWLIWVKNTTIYKSPSEALSAANWWLY